MDNVKVSKIFACKIKQSAIPKNPDILSDSETKRLKKFKDINEARLFLSGKLLTRKVISLIIGIDQHKIIFKSDKFNRPSLFFPKIKDFYFNLSHSEEWVVLAISNQKVGIDVEKVLPIDLKMASNYFHEKEIGFIHLDNKNKFEEFYTLWTLKESFIKAIGRGMSCDLKSFYFEFKKNRKIILHSKFKKRKWHFKMYNIDSGYKLALCVEGKKKFPKKIEFIKI